MLKKNKSIEDLNCQIQHVHFLRRYCNYRIKCQKFEQSFMELTHENEQKIDQPHRISSEGESETPIIHLLSQIQKEAQKKQGDRIETQEDFEKSGNLDGKWSGKAGRNSFIKSQQIEELSFNPTEIENIVTRIENDEYSLDKHLTADFSIIKSFRKVEEAIKHMRQGRESFKIINQGDVLTPDEILNQIPCYLKEYKKQFQKIVEEGSQIFEILEQQRPLIVKTKKRVKAGIRKNPEIVEGYDGLKLQGDWKTYIPYLVRNKHERKLIFDIISMVANFVQLKENWLDRIEKGVEKRVKKLRKELLKLKEKNFYPKERADSIVKKKLIPQKNSAKSFREAKRAARKIDWKIKNSIEQQFYNKNPVVVEVDESVLSQVESELAEFYKEQESKIKMSLQIVEDYDSDSDNDTQQGDDDHQSDRLPAAL